MLGDDRQDLRAVDDAVTWTHIKTGNLYRVIHRGIDCTGSRDGTPVVVYRRDGQDGPIYVREQSEFDAKFQVRS